MAEEDIAEVAVFPEEVSLVVIPEEDTEAASQAVLQEDFTEDTVLHLPHHITALTLEGGGTDLISVEVGTEAVMVEADV